MITEKNASTVNGPFKVLLGLSTDSKPTDVANGTAFVEINTGKKFLFNEAGSAWVEQPAGGTSDYSDLTNKPSINGVTLTGDKTLAEFGSAFYVYITSGTQSVSQDTVDKISSVLDDGGNVYVVYENSSVVPLAGISHNMSAKFPIRFETVNRGTYYRFIIAGDGDVTPFVQSLYPYMLLTSSDDGETNVLGISTIIANDSIAFTGAFGNLYSEVIESGAGGDTFTQLLLYLIAQAKANSGGATVVIPSAMGDAWMMFFNALKAFSVCGALDITSTIVGYYTLKVVGERAGDPILVGVFDDGNNGLDEATIIIGTSDLTVLVKNYPITTVPFPSV